MEILKLTLTVSDDDKRKFNVSAENYGSERSQLPFFDDGGNSHIHTVLNALNAIDRKYSSKNNDREWMKQEGLLDPGDDNFYNTKMRETIGKKLYEALFQGNIKPGFNQTNLHIHIEYDFKTIKDSNLSLYPWHLVHDGANFLAQKGFSFSYSIAHPNYLPSGKRKIDKLKVLVISSQAISSQAADADSQRLTNQEPLINNSLQQLREQGKASLLSWHEESQTPTYRTLRNYLTANRTNKDKMPDIIHFNGHGVFKKKCDNPLCPKCDTNEIFFNKGVTHCQHCSSPLNDPTGFLLFPDEEGNADYISAERFADLIDICDPKPQLIVITACKAAYADKSDSVFNGVAQNLLQKVPAVVATPFTISENSVKGFIEQFYRILSNGKSSLLDAVRLATNEMKFKDYEWYRFVIFLRHDGDKDGYLFEFEETSQNRDIQNNQDLEILEILKDLLIRSGKITSNRIVRKNFCQSIGININDIAPDNLDNLNDDIFIDTLFYYLSKNDNQLAIGKLLEIIEKHFQSSQKFSDQIKRIKGKLM